CLTHPLADVKWTRISAKAVSRSRRPAGLWRRWRIVSLARV
ncbi:hypothetical protein, partial [Pseudomonas sp. FEN]